MTDALSARVVNSLRAVPDFPTAGVMFRDITPLLADHTLLVQVIRAMSLPFERDRITHVVGIESRGFMFGVPIALALGAAFVPARKPGKLPWKTIQERFALEYGADALELHVDALNAQSRVLIVDDVLATGGTAAAAGRLVNGLDAQLIGISVLAEIAALAGRSYLAPVPVHSLVQL